MLRSRRFLTAVGGTAALAAGGAGFAGGVALAGAHPSFKQCGHIAGTIAVTVTKGDVSCRTARAVAKAWANRTTPPSGFHCKTYSSHVASGHYGICKKGTTKIVHITPE
jgi:hypothetical protein